MMPFFDQRIISDALALHSITISMCAILAQLIHS